MSTPPQCPPCSEEELKEKEKQEHDSNPQPPPTQDPSKC